MAALKWLHENTTHPFERLDIERAIGNGCHSIVEYLNEVGAPFPQYPIDIALHMIFRCSLISIEIELNLAPYKQWIMQSIEVT
ncbi:hypothetical protein PPL_06646 [Heterostelium album PN500]|uniref:Uncharacterized protein n=1 Tax=Heterostelium pallidum (strain ATCC 26659 / Pp 5 / PN500) TaxID=670386 RepID=D3BFB3_HETP5|nr:hypothetical protein PPL_06646 [Heterostelium album PN500]EFA79827.1 hypothetical protein PPL_06646 [Heterostelium album PN500]|eukprot:XP_020431948.1 hypothetical protein PPL_06646 [Heterostelium album PN500]